MVLFVTQFAIVLICIGIGGRFGGIGLGAAGGLGLAILTFGFGLPPDSPPFTVISIILAVITCITILQAAGGLDLFVTMAERILRKWPGAITFLGPQSLTFLLLSAEQDMLPFRFIQSLLKLQQMPGYGQREPCRCQ
ncbi:anaerobic C4-dicarboxylate transporter family protein [Citrobacter braakii]